MNEEKKCKQDFSTRRNFYMLTANQKVIFAQKYESIFIHYQYITVIIDSPINNSNTISYIFFFSISCKYNLYVKQKLKKNKYRKII